MLVIITTLSVVLAASATTLLTLFRLERQIGDDAEQRQGLARLASRFRTDVHEALACDTGDACTLTMPGGETIRYTAKETWLWRERLAGDTVEHRDAFPLASGSAVEFDMGPLDDRQLVKLSILRASAPLAERDSPSGTLAPRGAGRPQPHPTVIEAVVNLHGPSAEEDGP